MTKYFACMTRLSRGHQTQPDAQVTVMNPLELPDPNTWSLECLGSRDRWQTGRSP